MCYQTVTLRWLIQISSWQYASFLLKLKPFRLSLNNSKSVNDFTFHCFYGYWTKIIPNQIHPWQVIILFCWFWMCHTNWSRVFTHNIKVSCCHTAHVFNYNIEAWASTPNDAELPKFSLKLSVWLLPMLALAPINPGSDWATAKASWTFTWLRSCRVISPSTSFVPSLSTGRQRSPIPRNSV